MAIERWPYCPWKRPPCRHKRHNADTSPLAVTSHKRSSGQHKWLPQVDTLLQVVTLLPLLLPIQMTLLFQAVTTLQVPTLLYRVSRSDSLWFQVGILLSCGYKRSSAVTSGLMSIQIAPASLQATTCRYSGPPVVAREPQLLRSTRARQAQTNPTRPPARPPAILPAGCCPMIHLVHQH